MAFLNLVTVGMEMKIQIQREILQIARPARSEDQMSPFFKKGAALATSDRPLKGEMKKYGRSEHALKALILEVGIIIMASALASTRPTLPVGCRS